MEELSKEAMALNAYINANANAMTNREMCAALDRLIDIYGEAVKKLTTERNRLFGSEFGDRTTLVLV